MRSKHFRTTIRWRSDMECGPETSWFGENKSASHSPCRTRCARRRRISSPSPHRRHTRASPAYLGIPRTRPLRHRRKNLQRQTRTMGRSHPCAPRTHVHPQDLPQFGHPGPFHRNKGGSKGSLTLTDGLLGNNVMLRETFLCHRFQV